MQYDVTTPEEYIQALEEDWRKEKLQQLRSIIRKIKPPLKEGIDYKMLSYSDKGGLIFCLNAQKKYVSLYFGDTKKVDPDGSLLKGINCGKGCIRFTKSVDIPDTKIDQFITKAVSMWKKGIDIDC